MASQLDMIGQESPELDLPEGQAEPRFWVKRLLIWQEPGAVIRDIQLRPGLNILWSPDSLEAGSEKSGSGHGSGKSLFCRLIRYCLGEPSYAPEEQQIRIAQRFHNGLVGVELRVNGSSWSVIRSLGPIRTDCVAEESDVMAMADKLEHDSDAIPRFLRYLENALLGDEAVSLLSTLKQGSAWLMALAWMSRDQECRFDHVLDWRSAATASGSPARNMSKRQRLDIVRILLGAITNAELAMQGEMEARDKKKEKLESTLSKQKWSIDRNFGRLCDLLGIDRTTVGDLPLAIQALRSEAVEQLAKSAGPQQGDDLFVLREQYEKATEALSVLKSQHSGASARKEEREDSLRKSKATFSELSIEKIRVGSPMCRTCEVPINRIKAEGCGLSDKFPDFAAIEARDKKIRNEIKESEGAVLQLKNEISALEKSIEKAAGEVDRISRRLKEAEREADKRREAWYKARRAKDESDELEKLFLDHVKDNNELDSLSKRVDKDKAEMKRLRSEKELVFRRLSALFGATINCLLEEGATGSLSLDGSGLQLKVEYYGDRSTAAIDSLKIIAFDIMALSVAMEGKIALPAFLIHDSPREADMGLSIYSRIFHKLLALEETSDTPLFQYIVTTTSPPPEKCREEPWLMPSLSGSPADKRLLKADI